MIPFLFRLFNNRQESSTDTQSELPVNNDSERSSNDTTSQPQPSTIEQPTNSYSESTAQQPETNSSEPETENTISEDQHPAPSVRLRPYIRVVMPIVLPQEFIDDTNPEANSQASPSQTVTRQIVTEFVFMLPSPSIFVNEDQILNTLFNMQQPQGPPPATTETIDNLKSVPVTEALIAEQPKCCICYDDFMCENSVTLLPCKHIFDKECIVTWLKIHNTCPVCRHSIKDEAIVEKVNTEATEVESSNTENTQVIMTDTLPAENTNEEEMKQPEKNPSRPHDLNEHQNGHCSDCTD